MTALDSSSPEYFKEIAADCNKYKGAETWRSIFQLVITLSLFIISCSLMLYSLDTSYWIESPCAKSLNALT